MVGSVEHTSLLYPANIQPHQYDQTYRFQARLPLISLLVFQKALFLLTLLQRVSLTLIDYVLDIPTVENQLFPLILDEKVLTCLSRVSKYWRHDSQHNDTWYNDTWHNDTWHNDT
jgi:hypothetical protein